MRRFSTQNDDRPRAANRVAAAVAKLAVRAATAAAVAAAAGRLVACQDEAARRFDLLLDRPPAETLEGSGLELPRRETTATGDWAKLVAGGECRWTRRARDEASLYFCDGAGGVTPFELDASGRARALWAFPLRARAWGLDPSRAGAGVSLVGERVIEYEEGGERFLSWRGCVRHDGARPFASWSMRPWVDAGEGEVAGKAAGKKRDDWRPGQWRCARLVAGPWPRPEAERDLPFAVALAADDGEAWRVAAPAAGVAAAGGATGRAVRLRAVAREAKVVPDQGEAFVLPGLSLVTAHYLRGKKARVQDADGREGWADERDLLAFYPADPPELPPEALAALARTAAEARFDGEAAELEVLAARPRENGAGAASGKEAGDVMEREVVVFARPVFGGPAAWDLYRLRRVPSGFLAEPSGSGLRSFDGDDAP